MTQVATVRTGRARKLWRFALHAAEMLVAMAVGMMLLGPLWDALWPGLADNAAASALVMGVDMAAGMALWMWLRGHGRQMVAEMSVAMVGPFAVLLIPYWLGVLSGDGVMTFGHVGMLVAMFAAMVLRFDAYTRTHQWRLPIRRDRRPGADGGSGRG